MSNEYFVDSKIRIVKYRCEWYNTHMTRYHIRYFRKRREEKDEDFICRISQMHDLQKAKKWLEEHQVDFEDRDIREKNPTAEELKLWHQRSGLPLKRFFNTSGLLYKSMQLKDRLPDMSEEEQIALLAGDGMLVKRPLIVRENTVLVGFKEAEWEKALL